MTSSFGIELRQGTRRYYYDRPMSDMATVTKKRVAVIP
jgi:hypothetical protein